MNRFYSNLNQMFQHTAARRRLGVNVESQRQSSCFNTQPPEGGCATDVGRCRNQSRFNTQPPEGGWPTRFCRVSTVNGFQHTAARRRLDQQISVFFSKVFVSTHSRPKAAALSKAKSTRKRWFQHTAARRRLKLQLDKEFGINVSTHSRPKAAANCLTVSCGYGQFQHTAARRRLRRSCRKARCANSFQHTAARRRLTINPDNSFPTKRFQHTAARRRLRIRRDIRSRGLSFNTQPPEGG